MWIPKISSGARIQRRTPDDCEEPQKNEVKDLEELQEDSAVK